MKFDLAAIRSDSENFMVHEHQIGGDPVFLVQPVHIGAHWRKDNLTQRSIVVTSDGSPVSLSFKKFFNWDEQPALVPIPENLNYAELIEKIDGSTLLVSKYKGNLVIRTRGTVDARQQDNGAEIDVLIEKYPNAFNNWFVNSEEWTAIFEWYSPSNRIVVNYGDEPLLYLTAIVEHARYVYLEQSKLDTLAKEWDVLRPAWYRYSSLEEMKQSVEAFEGKEGLCVYFNYGQDIRKVKGAEYLYLHRAKSDIASIEKVIDLYLDFSTTLGRHASYNEFFAYLETSYDYEIATMARGHVSDICDAIKEVRKIIHGMNNFLTPIMCANLPRKDVAQKVMQAYGKSTGRTGLVFKLYDRKPLISDDIKRLLFQVLKK